VRTSQYLAGALKMTFMRNCLTPLCRISTISPVYYDVERYWDEGLDLDYPVVKSERRPRQIMIGPDPIHGWGMSPDEMERTFVVITGTDLWVPRREAYIAFGGELPYDVVFEVGFDGVQSPLREVRLRQRPDRPQPVTSALIRTVKVDSLVRKAISENRTAYRQRPDGMLVSVSPEERLTINVGIVKNKVGEARRRVPVGELRRAADIYLRAIAERRSPTKAVEDELRLPNRNTAKKRVERARAEGFLPPAPGPRRGGVG